MRARSCMPAMRQGPGGGPRNKRYAALQLFAPLQALLTRRQIAAGLAADRVQAALAEAERAVRICTVDVRYLFADD